jgi:hypothetical protein
MSHMQGKPSSEYEKMLDDAADRGSDISKGKDGPER